MELIWETTLDNRYQCKVQRVSQYTGMLKIYDTLSENKEIFSKDVGLSYGAVFGPDVEDVADWKEAILDAIDNKL